MATPTLTLINAGSGTLTDGVLSNADSNTGWTDLTTADTDIKVEGTGSMSGIFRADGEQGYYDAGGAPITAVGKVYRSWFLTNNLPYMNTEATDAYKLLLSDGTTDALIDLFGSDTYPGGWVYFFQDMDLISGPTLANVDRWGIESGHASNAKNVVNSWHDVMRYMDGYYMTGGTSGDKILISNVSTTDTSSAYGIVQEVNGVYFGTGTIQVGNGATTTYFSMDGAVLQFIDTMGSTTISAGLYEISATGSGCNCDIRNSVIRGPAAGASTRIYFDFSDTNHTLNFTGNLVVDAGTIQFASGQTATGNTFDDCLLITHGGADMTSCTVKNYEGTAGTAALLYNVNADPDGEMDDMTFIKGTAATHAIELGSSCPSSITLRGLTVSGYNTSDGQNDSVIYNNSGKAITVNIANNTGAITYRNGTSASTTIATDPATTTITVKDIDDMSAIENARVLLIAADATGDFPYEETVTIARGSDTVVFDERFEGTGYEETWSEGETLGTGVTLDEDKATSGVTGAPASWDSQCIEYSAVAAEDCYVEDRTLGNYAISYSRLEVIVESNALAVSEYNHICSFRTSGAATMYQYLLAKDGSGDLFISAQVYHDATSNIYSYPISLDTLYVLETYWDSTNDLWSWRVNGVEQDNGTLTAGAAAYTLDRIRIGDSGAQTDAAHTLYADNLIVSTTNWPDLSGTSVATVTHTGHGMATGDIAYISGANQNEYNGAFEITVTTANAYTYNVPGLPTTPATGTIKSTGGIFNHLTNSSGIVTDTRSWTNDQPFTGRVRKGSTPKYYHTAPLAGTIDTSAGYTTTIFMLPD